MITVNVYSTSQLGFVGNITIDEDGSTDIHEGRFMFGRFDLGNLSPNYEDLTINLSNIMVSGISYQVEPYRNEVA